MYFVIRFVVFGFSGLGLALNGLGLGLRIVLKGL